MTQTPPNAEVFKPQLPQIIDLFTLDITPILAFWFVRSSDLQVCELVTS